MGPTVILGVLLLLVAGGIILFLVRRQPSEEELIRLRMMEYGDRETPVTLEEIEFSLPFMQRVVLPVVRKISDLVAQVMPANVMESTRHKLELAGRPRNLGPAEFIAIRFVAAVMLGGLSFFLFRTSAPQYRFLFPPLLLAFGFFLPVIWLGSRIRSRQSDIIKALPDALDLLTICVEAGLGLDAAMQKIAEKWDDALSMEFARVIAEMQLGKLRREALRDMADRVEVSDVSTFVAAVIQADQLGVSMSKVLRIQSDQMRIRRRQRAEKKAHEAPVKMLFPLVFLIFPALLVVLLGPAIIVLLESGVIGVI